MKTIELLNKAIELGFDREKALEDIDASLDEVIGVENRKAITEEEVEEELANNILFGFSMWKGKVMRYAIYYTLMCKEDSMNVENAKRRNEEIIAMLHDSNFSNISYSKIYKSGEYSTRKNVNI